MRFVVSLMVLGATVGAWADETPVASRVVAIGLFKNGLAVVRREVAVPGPGTYLVQDVPTPIHGTFWVESNAKITTRMTRRLVDVPLRKSTEDNLQEELVGSEVVVHFAEQGLPTVHGVVAELAPARGGDRWNRTYESPGYYPYYGAFGGDRLRPSRPLVIVDGNTRTHIDRAKVAYVEVKGAGGTVKQRKPVMLVTVAEAKAAPATVSISYLAKGMAWSPSYQVDLQDDKTLELRQSAVIKNELESIDNVRLYLISGFPSIRFANVTSPLSLETSWAEFFQQLNQRRWAGHDSLSNVVSQQAVSVQRGGDQGVDLSAIPAGEGVDLHYRDIGRQTLDEGDALNLETASGRTSYERIVEWLVPDSRDEASPYAANADRDEGDDGAWDVVRFRNPLDSPMTTAPALVASGQRFAGQQMSYWVNRGEETTIRVTKALNIRTQSTEQEVDANRESSYFGRVMYRKATVQGELRASNHRQETVTLLIRRRFSGQLITADGSPKQTLLEEGVRSANRRSQLVWTVNLKPGEEIKLAFRYSVLVRQ